MANKLKNNATLTSSIATQQNTASDGTKTSSISYNGGTATSSAAMNPTSSVNANTYNAAYNAALNTANKTTTTNTSTSPTATAVPSGNAQQYNLQQTAVSNAGNKYTSSATQAALANLDKYNNNPYSQFMPSSNTNEAYKYWQQVLKERPDDYQSQYKSTLDNLLDQIVNREEFSYDFNADPLYQNYKNQYTTQGKQAMKDTIATASALTGGYGNTYATTAGEQAYQEYLENLNAKIPELYNAALNKYKTDTDTLNSKFSAVGSQEDREFNQWNSKMGIWQNDRSYGLNAYNTLWTQDFNENQFNYNVWKDNRTYDYQKYRDSVSDDNTAYSNAYTAALNAQQYDYNTTKDANDLAYKRERDAVTDQHWAAEMALKQKTGTGTGSSSSSSKTTTNTTTNTNLKLTSGEKKITNTDEYKDAYNYASRIFNNTYSTEGEYTTIAYLTNMVNSGQLRPAYAEVVLKQLGIDPDSVDADAVNSWMTQNNFTRA